MEIVGYKKVFDDNFILSLNGNNDNYLNKLLEFTIQQEPDLQEEVISKVDELKERILSDVISSENEDDYEDDYIESVRKEKIEFILFCINNYLLSLTPSDGVDKFINTDFNVLIQESKLYTNSMLSDLANKVSYLKKVTNIEYNNYVLYAQALDVLSNYAAYRDNFSMIYGTMKREVFIVTKDTSLLKVKEVVEELLHEATIITKFNNNARTYVSSMLNKSYNQDIDDNDSIENKNNIVGNICESLLMNYSLLSVYSNKPEDIKISDNMLKSIMFEVENGTITKEDIIDFIENGNIKFTDEEIQYIKDSFIKKMFYREDKTCVQKQDLLKLVK